MNKFFGDEKAIGGNSSGNESSEGSGIDEESTDANATNSDSDGSSDKVIDDARQPFDTVEAGDAGMGNLTQ